MSTASSSDRTADPQRIEFYFDYMCPYAYQTSLWIREARDAVGFEIDWRFFSLEEINRENGKPHPWERELAYGWSPMRVAAWLRRHDMAWCDTWYAATGRALHIEGRRPYDRDVALELLKENDLPTDAWDLALADPTTHDDVRNDHMHAVNEHAGFGVPIIVIPGARALFGPVVLPAPTGQDAIELWNLTKAYVRFPGLFEMKTPKTDADMAMIGEMFRTYLETRQWRTIQNPAR